MYTNQTSGIWKLINVLASGVLLSFFYGAAYCFITIVLPSISTRFSGIFGIVAISVAIAIITSLGAVIYTSQASYIDSILQWLGYIVVFFCIGMGLFIIYVTYLIPI